MGTRSLTAIVDRSWDKPQEICVLYRQYDGYPSGHGKELKEFLQGMRIVNGIRLDERPPFANGMSCLAAQLVAHFKKDAKGGFYLHEAGTRGQQYLYIVSGKFGDPEPTLEVFHREQQLYSGPVSGFDPDKSEDEEAA